VSQLIIDGATTSISQTTGPADPSVSPGVAALPGSVYFQQTATTGEAWIKTGPANTDWERAIAPAQVQAVTIMIDGGGSPISPGVKGAAKVPVGSTLDAWEIVSVDNTTGDIIVELWQDTYPNFPPTSADIIGAEERPTLNAQTKNADTSLNGGVGYPITGGNWIMWNVLSASDVKIVALALTLTRT
jgi:hypothetical protein